MISANNIITRYERKEKLIRENKSLNAIMILDRENHVKVTFTFREEGVFEQ